MALYEKQYTKPYPDGYVDKPVMTTPVTAAILNLMDAVLTALEDFLASDEVGFKNALTVGYRLGDVGAYSSVLGQYCKASGSGSHAEGKSTNATGEGAHAEGLGATASGSASHAEGQSAKATGNCAHAEGTNTTASGAYSHAEGGGTTASGAYTHAEGQSTTVTETSTAAHAEGYQTKASGKYAHAEGYGNTEAGGEGSHAEGCNTHATGSYSHTEGVSTFATTAAAHAEGSGVRASGDSAHAEGSNTTASGTQSHAEGIGTKAIGISAHAEGSGAQASGGSSHAEGSGSAASGNSAHAEGLHTIASGNYQHVQGKYNVEDTEGLYAHIVGGGSANTTDDEGNTVDNRKNIHTVDWQGNAYYAGDVTNGNGVSLDGLMALIGTTGQLRTIVTELPTEDISTETIYMVLKESGSENDIYNEYINTDGTVNGWEFIGNSAVDLTGYYTAAQVDDLLAGYVASETGKGLSSEDYTAEDRALVESIRNMTAADALAILNEEVA